jgi:hypothetical protein
VVDLYADARHGRMRHDKATRELARVDELTVAEREGRARDDKRASDAPIAWLEEMSGRASGRDGLFREACSLTRRGPWGGPSLE